MAAIDGPVRAGDAPVITTEVGLEPPQRRERSTATSGILSVGPKPCSANQRTASKLRNDHHAVDHVQVDVRAIAGDDVAEVLLVGERESGQVEQPVTLARLGPVEDAADLVTIDEDVGDLQVAVREHRCPRPERSFGEATLRSDHVGGKDVVGDKPLALAVEPRPARRGSSRATVAAARRAASVRRRPLRPTPLATRSTARRDDRAPCLGAPAKPRAPAASATGSPVWGQAPSPWPRPRRRCARTDQRRSSGRRRRRAGCARSRHGRRRPRPHPCRPIIAARATAPHGRSLVGVD